MRKINLLNLRGEEVVVTLAKKPLRSAVAKVPRLKSGVYTAYAVLRHLQKVISREPKRLNMMNWEYLYGFAPAVDMKNYTDAEFSSALRNGVPECGTVACAAGWINIITGHQRLNNTEKYEPWLEALRTLGLGTSKEWWEPAIPEKKAGDDLIRLFDNTLLDSAKVFRQLGRILKNHRKVLIKNKVRVR